MSGVALLPCPFCGTGPSADHTAIQVQPYHCPAENGWEVLCEKCGANGASSTDKSAAIAAWNTRADAAHREAHTAEMLGVLHQYVSDLRYPPTGDSIQRRIERAEAVIAKVASITDCGPDGGCEECDVCRYLNFLEWAGAVGKPEGSTIERNDTIDAYLRVTYPDQFAAGK